MAFTIVATFQFSDSDDLKKTLKLFVYEVYQDKDAFKSHASGESLKELDADIENLGVEFEMTPVFGAGVK
jgi:quinol monooxygenase YgiN